jgi:hypothetical protein
MLSSKSDTKHNQKDSNVRIQILRGTRFSLRNIIYIVYSLLDAHWMRGSSSRNSIIQDGQSSEEEDGRTNLIYAK